MTRITERELTVPDGVQVEISDTAIAIAGPHGRLAVACDAGVQTEHQNGALLIRTVGQSRHARAMTGTICALLRNAIKGVTEKWQKRLLIEGVGYRAQLQNNKLVLLLGYSHPVEYTAPRAIELTVPSPTEIVVSGIDRQLVGQAAADIRSERPPEPYKGKGVRYVGEYIKRKEVKK